MVKPVWLKHVRLNGAWAKRVLGKARVERNACRVKRVLGESRLGGTGPGEMHLGEARAG